MLVTSGANVGTVTRIWK